MVMRRQVGRPKRKLAAILSADVKGYSRLTEADEEGTHRALKTYRDVMAALIARHDGRVAGTAGDSVLAEFMSSVEAVRCAAAVQGELAKRNAELPQKRRLEFRMGINLGEVILERDGIYGDSVNVAARLQALAEPGGICVSGSVYDQVRGKLPFRYAFLGEQRLKNIEKPVRLFSVRRHGSVRPDGGDAVMNAAAPSLPDRLSVAVLPFDNFSGDSTQQRLADGLAEDLITELARFRDLFVIARQSTFAYKGRAMDVRQVGRELGTRYVLEGSIEATPKRLRVTAQLIDAATGAHVWSERYDRPLDDIFAVRDEVAQTIVGTIGGSDGRLVRAAQEITRRKAPSSDLQAYDCYLLANEHFWRGTREDNAEARRLAERAVALDPSFACAYARLATTHYNDAIKGWSVSADQSWEQFHALVRTAVTLDDADGASYLLLGLSYFKKGQVPQGAAAWERALALSPNEAGVLMTVGVDLGITLGRAEEGVELIKRAMRLNPHHPEWYTRSLGYALYYAQRYDDAVAAYSRLRNRDLSCHLHLALSYAQLGQDIEAAAQAAEVLKLEPDFSARCFAEKDYYTYGPALELFLDGARKAGLPM
jgi:adenylate cyclase